MVRFFAVLNVLSVVIMAFALCMLFPLACSFLLGDNAQAAFDEAVLLTALAGAVLWALTRKKRRELQPRDGFLLVTLVWTALPAFATLPLLFYLPELSFTGAYFEAVSGLTTTGATVLSGLDKLPYSINIWRTFLVWIGGMGVIVLAVAILPILGVGGSQMYKTETPGPMKDTKLTPRIAETAKGLWLVYVMITVACLLSFRIAGMNWLDAMMHAFSTIGLGAFSSHDASFGHWNSPAVEAVAIYFMLLAGINFGTHFLAWRRRSFAPYARDPEAGLYLLAVIGSVFAIAYFLLANQTYTGFWTALRFSAFNVVSIATTTGFSNTDFNLWPIFAPVWMLFLCGFCTCSGSTGGGIKMIRAELMARQAVREMTRIIHPRALVPVKLGGVPVENNIIFAVLAFVLIYVASFVAMTMLLAASGLDIITAFSAVIACINNTGPGLNQVGPATTYASLNSFQIWICTVAMLLGRLELFTLLVVFTPRILAQVSAAGMQAGLRHIPTSLITGYLGAGKTAAILALLARRPEGEHWAVLVNDFDQSGSGHTELLGVGGKDVTVSKVAGGCICCTAQVSLRVALMRLLRQARPDRLLIEPAGQAHPSAVIATLHDPWLAGVLELRASVCIADPRQFADPRLAANETYLDQIALADIVVANKADLATPQQLGALLDHVRRLTPRKLRTLSSINGEFPLDFLELTPAARTPPVAGNTASFISTA